MESILLKTISFHNHTLQQQVPFVGMDLSWLIEFLKGMVKPVCATAVVFLAVGLSFSQKLGLEVEMIIAILRAFVQLSIIGFVLQFIFNQQNSGWILLAYLFMVSIAGYTAGQRAKQVPRGKYVAGASILTGTAITMFVLVALSVFPFTPRYIIPVAGMMVGNSMTVTGVTMKRLRDDIKAQINLVETALALGATPRQATHQQVKRALIIALSPVVDNTKTVGLISLPGAMTGLIMGGASPIEAIQLQIVVSIAGYTAGQRAKQVPRGKYVAGASILTGTAITMFVLVALSVFPFTPRYIIPVAGMMVGNSMTVTGVTMKRLRDDIKAQINLVETALALGATPRQATHQQVKRALIIALSPVVDNTKTVGLISLPGAMTGLIMGGASPIEAIQLQIVVMNMMIGAATISSIMATYLCWPAFFTKAYQLETKVFST
ncbi:protein ALUMINUM SENSITIVE [Trifolium repens]|nr:protein ALUMINUM SENSITIVE [Trifolium repens]